MATAAVSITARPQGGYGVMAMQQVSTKGALSTRQVKARLFVAAYDVEQKMGLSGAATLLMQAAAALGSCGLVHWLVS